MTTNQLIAMLFPVGALATAAAGGLIAKYIWVDRPRAREAAEHLDGDLKHTYHFESDTNIQADIDHAFDLLGRARARIHRAPARD